MRVGLDIDGVLADFITPFLRLLESRTGSDPIDPASITDPNFMQHPFLTREIIFECMETASYDPDFWRAMAPLPAPAQWQALDQMARDHESSLSPIAGCATPMTLTRSPASGYAATDSPIPSFTSPSKENRR